MAGFWDMVGKAANLLQILGVDAITLITIVASCFWHFRKVNKECRKLEDSVRTLRLLLLSPAGSWIMQQRNLAELLLGHLVANALRDADDLVRSYSESTPSLRVLSGIMSGQYYFRDLRNSIDSYCRLILSINAFLLVVQANPSPPPSFVRTTEVNRVGVPPAPGDSTDAETSSTAAPDHTHIVNISQE